MKHVALLHRPDIHPNVFADGGIGRNGVGNHVNLVERELLRVVSRDGVVEGHEPSLAFAHVLLANSLGVGG